MSNFDTVPILTVYYFVPKVFLFLLFYHYSQKNTLIQPGCAGFGWGNVVSFLVSEYIHISRACLLYINGMLFSREFYADFFLYKSMKIIRAQHYNHDF